jgi:undecaprenyl-diphosphatase
VTLLLTHLGGARATVLAGLVLTLVDRHAGLAALLANTLSHVVVQVLKRAVARPRPCGPDGRPLALVALPDPFSFPSGHAAAAFAVALPVAAAWPLPGVVALSAAALVAWSRVALRVHHASDVVAGAALGLAGAIAALQILA